LPKKNFILSKKDKENITLKEFIKKYKSLWTKFITQKLFTTIKKSTL
jgi:hypothetical protein